MITNFMEAGNDKLSTLQVTCSVRFPPILKLRALRKKLYKTSIKGAKPAAMESLITIIDGALQERLIWWFWNNSDHFFLDKHFTGVYDTER